MKKSGKSDGKDDKTMSQTEGGEADQGKDATTVDFVELESGEKKKRKKKKKPKSQRGKVRVHWAALSG